LLALVYCLRLLRRIARRFACAGVLLAGLLALIL